MTIILPTSYDEMLTVNLLNINDHDTLEIVLGNKSYPIELYAYCSDNTFLIGEVTLAKGLLNFVIMLDNWCAKIDALQVGESDFLPFDYADQSMSFLLIIRQDESNVSVQAAYTTEFFGWGTNPSQLYMYNFLSKSYHMQGDNYLLPITQLIDDINKSRAVLLKGLYVKPN